MSQAFHFVCVMPQKFTKKICIESEGLEIIFQWGILQKPLLRKIANMETYEPMLSEIYSLWRAHYSPLKILRKVFARGMISLREISMPSDLLSRSLLSRLFGPS
jgi:hypothetical protein